MINKLQENTKKHGIYLTNGTNGKSLPLGPINQSQTEAASLHDLDQ